MNARGFSVSFEIVTPGSAEAGDVAERGMVEDGLTLREALQLCQRGPCEPDSSPVRPGERVRWLTFCRFGEGDARGYGWRTGATESRSLHIPASMTAATSQRIARLVGAQGIARHA